MRQVWPSVFSKESAWSPDRAENSWTFFAKSATEYRPGCHRGICKSTVGGTVPEGMSSETVTSNKCVVGYDIASVYAMRVKLEDCGTARRVTESTTMQP